MFFNERCVKMRGVGKLARGLQRTLRRDSKTRSAHNGLDRIVGMHQTLIHQTVCRSAHHLIASSMELNSSNANQSIR